MKTKYFRKNETFFKWYKKNKDKITNVRIFVEQNKISVNYDEI